jgi:hypothetical protein
MGIIQAIFLFLRGFIVGRAAAAAENLALRQQVAVFKQSVKRPRLRPRDRVFWVWLSRLCCPRPASLYAPFGWADVLIQPPDWGVKSRWTRTRIGKAYKRRLAEESEMLSCKAFTHRWGMPGRRMVHRGDQQRRTQMRLRFGLPVGPPHNGLHLVTTVIPPCYGPWVGSASRVRALAGASTGPDKSGVVSRPDRQ